MISSKENITGKILTDKISQLLSDQQLKISVDKFQDLCNQPSVQPFLKWLCQYVGPDNVLSKTEVQTTKGLKVNNTWLTGDELDQALASALKDHPELESKVDANIKYETEISKAYEAEKEAYGEDLKYQASLNSSLKRLKELELKQDEELEKDKTKLEKLEIKNSRVYDDCLLITDDYDLALRELDILLQQTLEAYSELTKKRGPSICWNQISLDMYIKQMDTYQNYLEFYFEKNSSLFKKYFPDNFSPTSDEKEISNEENRIDSFMETELKLSETKLTNAFSKKIDSEICRSTAEAVVKRAIEIYNNGYINFPKTNSQLMSETAELSARREILLQNNVLLEQELKNCIDTYSELYISKVLVDVHKFRLEQKNKQLKQLKEILYITRDMGHAHSDLLSMLMQSQLRKLRILRRIVPESKHYLRNVYHQSSKRREYLQNLQTQYNIIDESSAREKNIYNKLFSQIVSEDDSTESFESSLKQYNSIISENINLKQEFLENSYNTQLQYLQALEKQVMIMYDHELNSGQTLSFKLMSNELTAEFEFVIKSIEENQNNFSQMRKKFKTLVEKISKDFSEREKEILWQKFIADPEGLKRQYDQLQNELNRSHFRNSSLN